MGFRGGSVDAQVANGFFSPRNPLFGLGFSQTIIGMYEELVGYALREQAGYQQVAAGIVQFLLGSVYYKHRNLLFNDSMAIRKIDEARALIKREVEGGLTPQGIAERLSVSYSWFRKMFRQYAGASPAQYLSQIRFLRAKELLDTTELTVAEIAYRLRFETPSHFSTFFRKREGVPPQQYRRERRQPGGNLLSRRPSPGFRAARRICGSLRRHVPHRWRSGAKAPPCSSGR